MKPDEARRLIAEGRATFDAHDAGWRRDQELAWLWANGRKLLDGYAEALDEIAFLDGTMDRDITALFDAGASIRACDLIKKRDAIREAYETRKAAP